VLSPGHVESNGEYILIASTLNKEYSDDPDAVLKVYEWVKSRTSDEISGLRQRCVFQNIPIWLMLATRVAEGTNISHIERDATDKTVRITVQTNNTSGWEYTLRYKVQNDEISDMPIKSMQCWEKVVYDESERDKLQYTLPTGQEWLVATLPHMLALSIAKRESTEGMLWLTNVKNAAKLKLGMSHNDTDARYMKVISPSRIVKQSVYRNKSLTIVVENMHWLENKRYHMWGA
jgi:hypothetical protein